MTTISNITSQPPLTASPSAGAVSQAEGSFSDFLKSTLDQVNQAQNASDAATQNLNTGGPTSMHEVMIAAEEADLSVRMLVQIRNQALQAYNTIMGMQV